LIGRIKRKETNCRKRHGTLSKPDPSETRAPLSRVYLKTASCRRHYPRMASQIITTQGQMIWCI